MAAHRGREGTPRLGRLGDACEPRAPEASPADPPRVRRGRVRGPRPCNKAVAAWWREQFSFFPKKVCILHFIITKSLYHTFGTQLIFHHNICQNWRNFGLNCNTSHPRICAQCNNIVRGFLSKNKCSSKKNLKSSSPKNLGFACPSLKIKNSTGDVTCP